MLKMSNLVSPFICNQYTLATCGTQPSLPKIVSLYYQNGLSNQTVKLLILSNVLLLCIYSKLKEMCI